MQEHEFNLECLVHRNNLLQKAKIATTDAQKNFVNTALGDYETYISSIDYGLLERGDSADATKAVEMYLRVAKALEKSDRLFNWRSDFAGSVLPEFIYRCLHGILKHRGLNPLFSTRDSVVEITLSGSISSSWNVRHKNQDLSVGLTYGKILIDGAEKVFLVPVVVSEVKTNIDINKLNGLEFSAERLKRTFPNARYFLITETIDFSLSDNYASSSIDEVYVLRKQVRSAARRELQSLSPDVFSSLFKDISEIVERASISRGHVYTRLDDGRLIHGDFE